MTAEEAIELLDMHLPVTRKVSCPKHSDSDPSLHVYPGDGGFYCYACSEGGDGWDLLSWFTGRSVGELMREAGHTMGPRPRTRWQQIGDIQHRARIMAYDFTVKLRDHLGLGYVEQVAERVDALFPWVWEREIPEEVAPVQLARELAILEEFYAEATERGRMLYSLQREPLASPQAEQDQTGEVSEMRDESPSIRDHLLSQVSGNGSTQAGPAPASPAYRSPGI